MSEAIAWPLGKLQLKCWRNAAAPGGRGRRITSLSTTSSRPPPAKAASQPASTINSRRAARRRATASARMVSVTGDPRRLIALKTAYPVAVRSEEHTSELQSRLPLVCRLLLEKKKSEWVEEGDGGANARLRARRNSNRRGVCESGV